jgi:hypothetical protein
VEEGVDPILIAGSSFRRGGSLNDYVSARARNTAQDSTMNRTKILPEPRAARDLRSPSCEIVLEKRDLAFGVSNRRHLVARTPSVPT